MGYNIYDWFTIGLGLAGIIFFGLFIIFATVWHVTDMYAELHKATEKSQAKYNSKKTGKKNEKKMTQDDYYDIMKNNIINKITDLDEELDVKEARDKMVDNNHKNLRQAQQNSTENYANVDDYEYDDTYHVNNTSDVEEVRKIIENVSMGRNTQQIYRARIQQQQNYTYQDPQPYVEVQQPSIDMTAQYTDDLMGGVEQAPTGYMSQYDDFNQPQFVQPVYDVDNEPTTYLDQNTYANDNEPTTYLDQNMYADDNEPTTYLNTQSANDDVPTAYLNIQSFNDEDVPTGYLADPEPVQAKSTGFYPHIEDEVPTAYLGDDEPTTGMLNNNDFTAPVGYYDTDAQPTSGLYNDDNMPTGYLDQAQTYSQSTDRFMDTNDNYETAPISAQGSKIKVLYEDTSNS